MKRQVTLAFVRVAATRTLAGLLIFNPMGIVTASATSAPQIDPGPIDVHYHHIHDHRGGVPLMAGLALGLIGAAEAAELFPYHHGPPYYDGPGYYYGGPNVGAYYYPEPRIYPPRLAFSRHRNDRHARRQHHRG